MRGWRAPLLCVKFMHPTSYLWLASSGLAQVQVALAWLMYEWRQGLQEERRGATWHLASGVRRGLTHSLRIPSQPSWNNLASAAVHFVIKSCSELTLIRRNQFSPRFRLNPAVGDDARLGLCLNHNWCRLIKSDHLRNASDLTFTNVISLIFTATAPTQCKRKIKQMINFEWNEKVI